MNMCFIQESEWSAEVSNVRERPANKASRCEDCGAKIEIGQWAQRHEQQEYEDCACECDHNDPDAPIDHEIDHGMTSQFDLCESCVKARTSIRAVEIEAGCRAHKSEPMFGELREAFEADEKYAERVARDYPELVESGWLKRMAGWTGTAIATP
jgi:hypothetical protein